MTLETLLVNCQIHLFFFSGQKITRKSSRIQDWVNFNIKSLGDSTTGSHDSDSGFEQSTKSNDFHSLYVEPWTNCHDEQTIKNRVRSRSLFQILQNVFLVAFSPVWCIGHTGDKI